MPITTTPPLDEAQLRRMVERFYTQVRADPELGPIFEARLAGRWPAHLDKMVGFWASALLGAGRYAGNPRAAHAAIPGLGPEQFARWLVLFEACLAELFEPATAAEILARAQAMAQGLQRGLGNHRRGLPLTEATQARNPS
jgi:hemoglobin